MLLGLFLVSGLGTVLGRALIHAASHRSLQYNINSKFVLHTIPKV